jgi:hypothetical protein
MAKSKIDRTPETLDLVLYAGDGVSIRLGVTDNSDAPVTVTGELKAQIRTSRISPDVSAEFSAVPEEGTGAVVISLTGEQTASLITEGETFSGVWDVQWHPPNSEPVTLTMGAVTCNADVTR